MSSGSARPDPLTADEKRRVFDAFLKHEPFYYPFVRVQFDAGMRPSETVALTWADAASFRVDYWDRVLDALKIRKRKF